MNSARHAVLEVAGTFRTPGAPSPLSGVPDDWFDSTHLSTPRGLTIMLCFERRARCTVAPLRPVGLS